MVEQISVGVVVVGKEVAGLFVGQVLNAGEGLEMEFDPEGSSFFVYPSEGVGAVVVHVSETVGSSSIAH